jgi:hypothetical protein
MTTMPTATADSKSRWAFCFSQGVGKPEREVNSLAAAARGFAMAGP